MVVWRESLQAWGVEVESRLDRAPLPDPSREERLARSCEVFGQELFLWSGVGGYEGSWGLKANTCTRHAQTIELLTAATVGLAASLIPCQAGSGELALFFSLSLYRGEPGQQGLRRQKKAGG